MITSSIINKPTSIFDRDREWSDLVRFASSPTARLGVVYGRRRLGKTHLVDHLATATGGLYFCAAQQSAALNLADLSDAATQWLRTELPIRYSSWDEALTHLLHVHRDGPPAVIVFDEVAYLVEQLPSFPSLLQRALDQQPRPSRPILLSGSTLGVMRSLTASGKPLRGRASLELVVHPFGFRAMAGFWNMQNSKAAIALWSVVGGTPGYKELCDNEAPTSEAGFADWLTRHVLSPSAALHREGRVVVLEDAELADPASHWTVLSAISGGARTRAAIAEGVGRPSSALGNSLKMLVSSGLVARDEDPLHGKRSTYRIAEPMVTTWKEIVEPIERRAVSGDLSRLFNDIEAPLHARVIGPAFEQLSRDWVMDVASAESVGGRPTLVSSGVLGRSPDSPTSAQLDIVAVEREASGRTKIIAIGEAKHRNRPMEVGQVRRLEDLRIRLTAPEAKLLLACDAGFDRETERLARSRSDIELVDADRLLRGD
jgi:AAA+ ATPase superfamily predicted ATPase